MQACSHQVSSHHIACDVSAPDHHIPCDGSVVDHHAERDGYLRWPRTNSDLQLATSSWRLTKSLRRLAKRFAVQFVVQRLQTDAQQLGRRSLVAVALV